MRNVFVCVAAASALLLPAVAGAAIIIPTGTMIQPNPNTEIVFFPQIDLAVGDQMQQAVSGIFDAKSIEFIFFGGQLRDPGAQGSVWLTFQDNLGNPMVTAPQSLAYPSLFYQVPVPPASTQVVLHLENQAAAPMTILNAAFIAVATPDPATLGLLVIGLGSLVLRRRA